MKRFVVACALVLSCNIGVAAEIKDNNQSQSKEIKLKSVEGVGWQDYCDSLSNMAYSVMSARQSGMSKSSAIESAKKSASKKMQEAITLDAYEVPVFDSDENKKQAASAFRDKNYQICAKMIESQRKQSVN